MRALLLDVNANRVEAVNANGLDDYYRLLGCAYIDIVTREINGTRYEIVCDDEGTFVENPKISAINRKGDPMLVGNLVIAGPAVEGELTDLTDSDMEHIRRNIYRISTRVFPEGYWMLTRVEY